MWNPSSQQQIWAVGGGKGGVGKSLISSSIAYTVARLGQPLIAIDLDLGGANLHTILGLTPPRKCVSDFLNNPNITLMDCVVETPYPNLKLIAGAKDDLNVTQLNEEKKLRLMDEIRNITGHYVILDLGAGINQYTLDFFNMANTGIVTALPEPTSIENAYRFLKAAYYHRLHQNPKFESVISLIEAAMTPNNSFGIQSPSDLLNEIAFRDRDLAIEMKKAVSEFKPKLIVNQTRSQTDIDVGFSMKSVAKKYFGIDFDYLGYLEYEPNVWQSVRRMRPILAEFPNSRIALHMERISNYLLKQARTGQSLNATE
jgi:flagellar biosynthesis protein FlhG